MMAGTSTTQERRLRSPRLSLMRQVLTFALLLSSTHAYNRYRRPQADRGRGGGGDGSAPSSLRVRPPPMSGDPISPDCYNFTIGNWRLQEFYSPNYPGEYLNSTDCVLYLEAPSGYRIHLDFRDEFTLEKSDDCKYDFLEVRDGPFAYSPLHGRYCDAAFPPMIKSTNRFLWLRFKSDDLLQYGGFRAVYSYHKDHTQNDGSSLSKASYFNACRIPLRLDPSHPDGVLTSQEVPFGDVTDPEFPRDQPVDCTWEIFTDQGHAINLHTIKMSRAKSVRCDASYVAIFQGTTLHGDRRARLCGNDAPDVMSLTSQSNRVFVRLYGSSLHAKPHLEMVYSLVKLGDHCHRSGFFSCGSDFCIPPSTRCNNRPNCPDSRDERGCPGRAWVDDARDGGGAGGGGGGGRGRGRGRGRGGQGGGRDDDEEEDIPTEPPNGGWDPRAGEGKEKEDKKKKKTKKEAESKIPLHMLILGAAGGIILTSILLGICIMCRSRKRRRQGQQNGKDSDRNKAQDPPKSKNVNAANVGMRDFTSSGHAPPSSQHHFRSEGRAAGGQGHPQGRYLTSAYVTPLPKDNPNRHSFTPNDNTNTSNDVMSHHHGDIMTDSGQFRRFLPPLDMGQDHTMVADDSSVLFAPPQGVLLGLTHPHYNQNLRSSPTTPQDTFGNLKYPQPPPPPSWQKGVMEDPSSLLYHHPSTPTPASHYTSSSLPRPSPFLEMSTLQQPYSMDHQQHQQQQQQYPPSPGIKFSTKSPLHALKEVEGGLKEKPTA